MPRTSIRQKACDAWGPGAGGTARWRIDVINRYISATTTSPWRQSTSEAIEPTIATTGPAQAQRQPGHPRHHQGGTNEGAGRTVDGWHGLNGDAYAGYRSWVRLSGTVVDEY